MKKTYEKPSMEVMMIQDQHVICASPSPSVELLTNDEGLEWDGSLDDDDV